MAKRGFSKEAVVCTASFNICSFILLLFATISSYWTWGYGVPPPNYAPNVLLGNFYVSFGQWVAGFSWSSYWVPCNCVNGFCSSWCTIASTAVMWNNIPAAAACDPLSQVYRYWSGPLGYCTFPSNFTLPTATPAPTSAPSTSTGIEFYGNVPAGTTFNVPSQAISMQALTVVATVTCFLAIVIGCIEVGKSSRSMAVAGLSVFCTLLTWVFSLAALCLWTTFPYVSKVVSNPPSVYVPIWVDVNSNYMSVIQVRDMWYGPAWGTIITATIITFLANLVQCASVRMADPSDDFYAPPAKGDAPEVPAAAQPIPTTAQPATASSVPPPVMPAQAVVANV